VKSISPDEMNRNFGFLVNDISRLISAEYNRIMSPLGLTRAQWRVIVYLHREDGLMQVDLAKLLGTGKVAVGGLVERLEKSGWVERRPDPRDGRSNRVYLTKKGRAIEKEMIRTGRDLTGRVLNNLSAGERRELTRLLLSVKGNLLEIEAEADEG
jgi:DNA-binding MarR family transcriptional regulator